VINGDTAAITGTGVHKELGSFASLRTETFNGAGQVRAWRTRGDDA
jgi:hypothetical protein